MPNENDFIKSIIEIFELSKETAYRFATELSPQEASTTISNLISLQQRDIPPPHFQSHQKAAYLKIRTIQIKILEGYKYQLEIFHHQGLNKVSSFFRETKINDLDEAVGNYVFRTKPIFKDPFKNDALEQYTREILSVYKQNLSSEQKDKQANAITLHYFGDALLLIEKLHHSAHPNAGTPFSNILKSYPSDSHNFAKKVFKDGCRRDNLIIASALTLPSFGMSKLEQHYRDLFKHFKQTADATLSSDIDHVTALTYLHTLQLRMDVIARQINAQRTTTSQGEILTRSSFPPPQQDRNKVNREAYYIRDWLPTSNYIEHYAKKIGNIDKETLENTLRKVQKICKDTDSKKVVSTIFPHSYFPADVFPDCTDVFRDYVKGHFFKFSLQKPAQGWDLVGQLLQQKTSQAEVITAIDQAVKGAGLDHNTIVKIQNYTTKLQHQRKSPHEIVRTIKFITETAKNGFSQPSSIQVGGLSSYSSSFSFTQPSTTLTSKTPRFYTWETRFNPYFKPTDKQFPFFTQNPYMVTFTPGMTSNADNYQHGAYVLFDKKQGFSFGQGQGFIFLPFQPQNGQINTPYRYIQPIIPVEVPAQKLPDVQKQRSGAFFACTFAPKSVATAIRTTSNQAITFRGQIIQLRPYSFQQQVSSYRFAVGDGMSHSSSPHRPPSHFNSAKQGKIVQLSSYRTSTNSSSHTSTKPSPVRMKPATFTTYGIGLSLVAQMGLSYMVQQDPYIYEPVYGNGETPYYIAHHDPLMETQNNFMMCVAGATVLTAQHIIMKSPRLLAGTTFVIGAAHKGATMLWACAMAHPLITGTIIVIGVALTAASLLQSERQSSHITSVDYARLQSRFLQRDYGDKAVVISPTTLGTEFRIYAGNLSKEQQKIVDAYHLPGITSISHMQKTRTDYNLQLLTIPNSEPKKTITLVLGYWESNKFSALKNPITTSYRDLRFYGGVKKADIKMKVDDKTRHVLGITK